jgi:hypothetical protein
MVDHIDHSQYASWMHCPWHWFEKYVNGRSKAWPEQMRDDALAIGSLVHNGLDNWYARGVPEIDQQEIEEINPTPDCLRLCKKLVYGYVQTFPKEQWKLIKTEQPLRFKLIEGKDGLAKLDLYFYIGEPTVVDSGLPGYEITLKPGWWIQEYKTKSQFVPTGDFMQSWVTNMQADFQMLALAAQRDNPNSPLFDGFKADSVDQVYPINGLLVNVIEKPNTYIPKRKCKGLCGEYWPYSSWMPSENALFKCPNCGNEQKLKPLEQMQEQEPRYFRMIVERTGEQLAQSREQIASVARNMQLMEHEDQFYNENYGEPFTRFAPNKTHCYDLSKRYARECEYYKPHVYGLSTIDNVDYVESEDYINEKAPISEGL